MDVNVITQQPASQDAAAILPKEAIRYITQNITPDEVQYVSDAKFAMDDYKNKAKEYNCKCCSDGCEDKCCDEKCCCENAFYVTKIMSFADKFRVLHWAAANMSYHKSIDDFCEELEEYKDAIAENIQSVDGQFTGGEFHHIELPCSDNPLEVINELKQCVVNWLQCIDGCENYEGCVNATEDFLETIHKYIYIFRICKD